MPIDEEWYATHCFFCNAEVNSGPHCDPRAYYPGRYQRHVSYADQWALSAEDEGED